MSFLYLQTAVRHGLKLTLILIASILSAVSVMATSPSTDSLSTNDLHNERSLQSMFRGEFENVDFNREDLEFEVLLRQFLNAYSEHCSDYLPANKVEITERECATERVTRNGFGTEISRVCVKWVDVGTGYYAKPDLYVALREIDQLMAADRVRQSWRLIVDMSQSNSMDGMVNMIAVARKAQSDMQALLQKNHCVGSALQRFEENIRRFALNEAAIRLDGAPSVPSAIAEAWTSFTSRDYAHLIDELILDQSQTWAMNRYMRGGVGDVKVIDRGRAPSRVEATYMYEGFNGRSRGSVKLIFDDGRPTCLEFFDAPGVCRTPHRRIVRRHLEQVGSRPANE